MGSFSSTHAVTYDAGDGSGSGGGSTPPAAPSTQSTGNHVITDGDADLTFETGDSVYQGGTLSYLGTVVIDGVSWPAFRYDSLPDFVVVYMDQAPVSVPPTLALNSGVTFNNACFATGTMIATPNGETSVEDLQIGDQILNADGQSVAVKWIGHSSPLLVTAGPRALPVRIRASALGKGIPHSDLTVTADHGMVLDGLVVNASALVNGRTIEFVSLAELPPRITYYHIETEAHDVILANGTPAETFVDAAGRASFDNYQEYVDLYGAERIIPEMDRPRITTQRLLPDAIRVRLGCSKGAEDHVAA